MLRLYFCRLPVTEPPFPEKLLSSYRREKLEKQKNARVRLQSLGSELLLRHALRDSGFMIEGPLDIAAGEYGKPSLKNGACCFSLSHSGDMLLCALCGREIGADIQLKEKVRPELIQRFFTAEERTFIFNAADPDAAFTGVWAKKESVCKRDGRGLALPLGSFSVLDEDIVPFLWQEKIGEYYMAVCSDALTEELPELIEVETGVLLP